MELANTAVKTALERFLELHKDAHTDTEFMDVGFNIIQTLLNNIHMAQSHMFAKIIGGTTKDSLSNLSFRNGEEEVYDNLSLGGIPTPKTSTMEYLSVNSIKKYEPEIDEYMTQFSNTTVSTGLVSHCNGTALEFSVSGTSAQAISELNLKRSALGLNPISKKEPIDDRLQKMRESSYQSPYNVFDEDSNITESLDECNVTETKSSNMWHDKINMDVEQCCARIGNQLFMIDHMEPEFLDNYPPDTYIDENGIVHGRSCLRTIDTKLFEKGQIFCNDHAYGYEDIRKLPINVMCQSPDIDFM
jgi:hypothetical protein